MMKCPMCNIILTDKNIALHNIPDTPKHGTVRLDSKGRPWCKECTDEFDSTDFDE